MRGTAPAARRIRNLVAGVLGAGVLWAGTVPAHAASPLTATYFYRAYTDMAMVRQAAETHRLTRAMAKYLTAPRRPIGPKAAVINALSWGENAGRNLKFFTGYLAAKYDVSRDAMPMDRLKRDDRFCLLYLALLNDYSHPQRYIRFFNRKLKGQSLTISIVAALTQAQIFSLHSTDVVFGAAQAVYRKMKKDPRYAGLSRDQLAKASIVAAVVHGDMKRNPFYSSYECSAWQAVDQVVRDSRLKQDLRPQARRIIMGYMGPLQGYCQSGK